MIVYKTILEHTKTNSKTAVTEENKYANEWKMKQTTYKNKFYILLTVHIDISIYLCNENQRLRAGEEG